MNNEKNKKIEEILGSLDNCQPAAAPDFFYTRLKARMQKGMEIPSVRTWGLRPVYALVLLTLVLVVNGFVIFEKNDTSRDTTADNESVQTIAAEYSLNDNGAIYELNQER